MKTIPVVIKTEIIKTLTQFEELSSGELFKLLKNKGIAYCYRSVYRYLQEMANRHILFSEISGVGIKGKTTFYKLNKNYKELQVSECKLCGFDKVIENHHLVFKKHGGSNDEENIVYLCHYHHRMLHCGLLTPEEMKELYGDKDTMGCITS